MTDSLPIPGVTVSDCDILCSNNYNTSFEITVTFPEPRAGLTPTPGADTLLDNDVAENILIRLRDMLRMARNDLSSVRNGPGDAYLELQHEARVDALRDAIDAVYAVL